jgi:hypothetical protein
MFSTTQIIRRLGAALAAVAALAALAAPSVLAAGQQLKAPGDIDGYSRLDRSLRTADAAPYGLDGWLRTAIAAHERLITPPVQPAPGTLDRHFQHEDRIFRGLDDSSAAATAATAQSSGFDLSSFGIGIGTGIGALLILAAVATRVPRLRQLVNA